MPLKAGPSRHSTAHLCARYLYNCFGCDSRSAITVIVPPGMFSKKRASIL